MSLPLVSGAPMHIGSYPVSLARIVAKARPTQVLAVAQWAPRGVDRAQAATLVLAGVLLAPMT